MSTLRVWLLGGFRACRDEVPLGGFRLQKAQALLAYLMLYRDRAHARSVLADLFWPDLEEPRAKANLRHCLYSVRKILAGPELPCGPYLLTQGKTVCFNPNSAYWLDVQEFEEKLATAQQSSGEERATLLSEAAALYTGDLLPGFYDDWVLIEQQHLRDVYLQALRELIEHHQACRDYKRAIARAQRALGVNAWSEALHQKLIELYALSEDRTAALQQYAECEKILQRELNIAPTTETRALYEKILRGELLALGAGSTPVAAATPPRHNLPRPLSRFIGRKKEIAQLKRWLVGAHVRAPLLTLTGVGGCGKTRLALQVASELIEEFADGVWLVELAGLQDPELIPQAIANVLGVRETRGGRSALDALSECLQTKHLLLVLDNCEHLIGACAQVAQAILERASQIRILATSRESLGLTGEVTWHVPPLLMPAMTDLPLAGAELVSALRQYEAVELFAERAASQDPDFSLTEANARAAAQICSGLDGIPLAIELAAARVPVLSMQEIAARVSDSLALLTQGSRTALAHHHTLRATLDWSFSLLDERERILWQRLSVFAGGFTLEAAEGVCAGKARGLCPVSVAQTDVLDLLTRLVKKSLVTVAKQGEQVRYRLLEIVRQYGAERLEQSKEAGAVRRRHAYFFLRMAERAEPELRGPDQLVWLTRLEREHDNLKAVLGWAREKGEAEAGLRMAGALWRFWEVRGYLREGFKWLSELNARAQNSPASLRAKVLNGMGALAVRQGDYAAARPLFEQSLAIQRELKDKESMAALLHNLGSIAWSQGDYLVSRSLHEESLAIRRELGDKRGIASSLAGLGNVAQAQGEYPRARALHTDSLALRRELGDPRGIASTLTNLGIVAQAQGDYLAARSHLDEALRIQRLLGDKQGMAFSLSNLGRAAWAQQDYLTARSLLEQALTLQQELGDQGGLAHSLNHLGGVAESQRDYAGAHSLYEASLAIYRQLEDKQAIAYVLTNLANVARAQGNYLRARTLLDEGLARQQELGDKRGIVGSLEGLAWLAHAQGDFQRAIRLLGAAESLRESLGAPQPPADRAEQDGLVTAAQSQLGTEPFATAWAQGRSMALEDAIRFALGKETIK
jgi:predicted ATPase/DNA-binding SARP family transcriptional activator